ncbi:hypothetical protein ACFLFF_30305 [Brevibacillus reuszeri]|uniref:hypothetical protein n=1 Tax=Brevibacillus reuszeri TaxID=54915 RepID=UPI00366BB737
MSEDKYGYNHISEIMRQIQEYPTHEIENKLGDIHERTNDIVQFNRIDETTMNHPSSYSIKMLRSMHVTATADYTSYYPMNDVSQKAGLLKKINVMDTRLRELEKGDKSDEE